MTRAQEPPDIKVVLRNALGKYLARDDNGLFFADERSTALVFNYRSDHVAEQLEEIQAIHGLALVVDPLPLEEVHETCDRCKELFTPLMIFFDGKRFLCPDCGRLASRRRGSGLPTAERKPKS
jgi:hypothetical protein